MPKQEKEVNMILSGKACKTTCKILAIFAKIGEVLLVIGAVCLAIAGVFIGLNQSKIDINQLVDGMQQEMGEGVITITGTAIEGFLAKSHNEQMSIILFAIVFGVVALAFFSILAKNVYQFFKNLEHNRTPFTLENVDLLQKSAIWLLVSTVTVDVLSAIIGFMVGDGTLRISFSLSYYALVCALLVLAVVFRHGHELEKKNKEK